MCRAACDGSPKRKRRDLHTQGVMARVGAAAAVLEGVVLEDVKTNAFSEIH